jgi:hypothetical protein
VSNNLEPTRGASKTVNRLASLDGQSEKSHIEMLMQPRHWAISGLGSLWGNGPQKPMISSWSERTISHIGIAIKSELKV